MIHAKDFESLGRQLEDCLRGRFQDVRVQIGDGLHYPGINVVVTSHKFAGLLAEQRFHHVVKQIPKELYEQHFQQGVVWFELAPGESGKDLMRMPRSMDVAGQEEESIRRVLSHARFFKKLAEHFDDDDEEPSGMSFEASQRILGKAGLPAAQIERCCLFMILRGAYCDAQVLNDLLPKMAAEQAA